MTTIGATMNCGTCEHWERHGDWHELDDYDVRRALTDEGEEDPTDAEVATVLAANLNRWGTCRRVRHGWGGSQRAYTQDASDYASSLNCRDDFGCVEWSPVVVDGAR